MYSFLSSLRGSLRCGFSFLYGSSSLLNNDLLDLSGKFRCRGGDNVKSVPPGWGICWSRSRVVDRCRVVGRGGLVNWSRMVDGGGLVSRGGGIGGSRGVGRSRGIGRSGLVGSRGRFVGNRGGFVSRSGGRDIGSRGGMVGSGSSLVGSRGICFLLWVLSFTLIPDISNISLRSSSVGYNLYSTIRKVYSVFSGSVVVVPFFLLRKYWSIVGIIHSILVVVAWSNSWVGISIRSRIVWSRVGARSNSKQSSDQNL